MQRRSDKSGPLRDDERAEEVQGLLGGGHESREEWREHEPAGEDQPEADVMPDADLIGEAPPGMSQRDVSVRSQLASYLGREVYPADRDRLAGRLADQDAPQWLVAMMDRLPPAVVYDNVQEVSGALGLGTEDHQF